MSEEQDKAAPGLLASAEKLLRMLVAAVHNRVELLVVEAQEAQLRLFSLLLLAAATVMCGLMTQVMLALAIVLAVDREHRVAAAVIITSLYLLATMVLYWRLRIKLKSWSAFSATQAELRKDREWLTGRESQR
jgi:uncharacterized membrane protein YqjE